MKGNLCKYRQPWSNHGSWNFTLRLSPAPTRLHVDRGLLRIQAAAWPILDRQQRLISHSDPVLRPFRPYFFTVYVLRLYFDWRDTMLHSHPGHCQWGHPSDRVLINGDDLLDAGSCSHHLFISRENFCQSTDGFINLDLRPICRNASRWASYLLSPDPVKFYNEKCVVDFLGPNFKKIARDFEKYKKDVAMDAMGVL